MLKIDDDKVRKHVEKILTEGGPGDVLEKLTEATESLTMARKTCEIYRMKLLGDSNTAGNALASSFENLGDIILRITHKVIDCHDMMNDLSDKRARYLVDRKKS